MRERKGEKERKKDRERERESIIQTELILHHKMRKLSNYTEIILYNKKL